MLKGTETVKRRTGSKVIEVTVPSDIKNIKNIWVE